MKKIKQTTNNIKAVSTEIIEDKELLNAVKSAIDYEDNRAKQYKCWTCGIDYNPPNASPEPLCKTTPDEWTCDNGHQVSAIGWEWSDVATSYHVISHMIQLGICKIKRKSNKHTEYRLIDREFARELVGNSERHVRGDLLPPQPREHELPQDLFDSIVGYDDVKRLMRRIVTSDIPTHILFVGPPASAKTMFQMDIEKLPGAFFIDGANVTRAGLTALLFEQEIRYLLIDEMEEMSDANVAALISFMQTGRLSETKFGRTRTKTMKTWIIGSCNTTRGFSSKLLSRLLKLEFTEYSYEQFSDIVVKVLARTRPKMSLAVVRKIGHAVWYDLGSRDMRDVIKISSLAQDSDVDLDWIIKTLSKYKT